MQYQANSAAEYIDKIPTERKESFSKLRQVILDNIPEGFKEEMGYGMIGFSVPHSIYPAGYHCDPKLPLPFIGIASQKNFIAVYHMGIYGDEQLLNWFTTEFPKVSKTKLDMGKSCIRFKKPEQIPFDLIGELAKKMTVKQWIDLYESKMKR
jgi:uncharacterized protein YdhG (YjbR/CyaY superfamily)